MTASPSWHPLVSQFETPLHHRKFQCIPIKFWGKDGTTPDANFHLAIKDGHPNLPLLQLRVKTYTKSNCTQDLDQPVSASQLR
jgi:hypothetical protein